MRKWIPIILLTLTWSFAALAAPQTLPTGSKLQGHFVEDRMTPGFTAPLHSEGEFIVAPGHGVIWRTMKPFTTTIIITPTGIAQDVDGERTMSLAASRIPFLSHLYDIIGGVMAGDRRALDTDFVVTESEKAGHWRLRATSRKKGDPTMPFTAIDVSGDRLVDRVVMTRADGGSDRLSFFKQSVSSKPLSASDVSTFNSVTP